MKTVLVLVVAFILAGGAVWYADRHSKQMAGEQQPQTQQILSFEECAAAGNPVMESYPRQCRTPEGTTFVEQVSEPAAPAAPSVTYVNADADDITVELPFPGAVTGKTFSVIGEARGPWYFEASFPVEVRDARGTLLASAVGTAQSEWTTTDFVPFVAEVTVPDAYIGPATLILRKDNPSGLPENDASVSFPITVEY